MNIRGEDFQLLTHGPGALTNGPGWVGVCVRTMTQAPRPFGRDYEPPVTLRELKVVANVRQRVQAMISQGVLDNLLRHRSANELVNIVTRSTGSTQEAEDILARVWPLDDATQLKVGLMSVARNLLVDEIRQERQRERMAAISLQLDLLKAGQQLDALRKRHARR